MAGYTTKVKRDIERWLEAGMIDAGTAGALSSDIERNGAGRISFGSVLSMMAAALFAAAILIFIAANWEDFPRLLRVGLLFALIVLGYVGGAFLKMRGHDGYAEAVWVVAAASFGASIALIGQMYHLSGDEKQAILIWCAGTALAAAALRSSALTAGAVLLAVTWLLMNAWEHWSMRDLPFSYLLMALALYALSFWTHSAPARHLVVLSISLFVLLLYIRDETFNGPLMLIAASVALFAIGQTLPAQSRRWSGLGSGLPVHALIAFLFGIGIMQVALIEKPEFLIASIAAFAGIVAALLVAGRESSMLRWLAYAAFIFQLCFVYVVMLGSMIGTAGFFVVGGLVLSVLAWIITRLERRFSQAGGVS
ncbi:DUF2157 domain-containing protein [Mesorhizobium sp. CAU 1732]|uniref:DUF2157 domain-containing protein n=1 Tax=Mesorhizobium sp. CAU 1732 TaxID=3140358 RepID=UPI003260491B